MASTSKTIHILGLGNLGQLTAHRLAANKSTSVILLLHSLEQVNRWEEAGQRIKVVTNGLSSTQSNFQYEKTFESKNEQAGQIYNLIVATKTYATTEALKPLRCRLNGDSRILFLQNGMGTVDEVTRSLFATPSGRPHYYTGIVTHGVYNSGAFSIVHAGQGSIRVGATRPSDELYPPTKGTTCAASSNDLLHCLCQTPGLSTSEVSEQKLLYIQLQKLAINAVINPLTAIFDCLNGQLFNSPRRLALSRLLLSEILPVISSVLDSSFTKNLGSEAILNFSLTSLEQNILDAADQTAKNISSMRQDMLNGRKTEIEYINGYIVAQGAKIGIDCYVNQMIVQLIVDKTKIADAEIPKLFPNIKCG